MLVKVKKSIEIPNQLLDNIIISKSLHNEISIFNENKKMTN
jgi:hypothetical protein